MGSVLTVALVLLLVGGTVRAQEAFLWGINYQVSIPTGNTRNFTDQISWRGVGIEGRGFVAERLAVGGSVSWNVFHEQGFRTDTIESLTVSGTQFRDLNAVPILATAHYYFGDRNGWRPYAGGGVGALYDHQRIELGLFRHDQDTWHFALAPEVGIQFPYDRLMGYIGLRYNYAAPTSTLPQQSWLTIMIGFGLR